MPKAGAEDNSGSKRLDSNMEPVCFLSMPEKLLEELLHTFFVKLVVDLTCPDGKFAWVCLKNRTGYVGITYTDYQSEMLMGLMQDRLKDAMLEEDSGFYNVSYAKDMGVTNPDKKKKAEEAAALKAAAKAKALAAMKKNANLKKKRADPDGVTGADGKKKGEAGGSAPKKAKVSKPKKGEEDEENIDGDESEESEEGTGESDDDVWDPLGSGAP